MFSGECFCADGILIEARESKGSQEGYHYHLILFFTNESQSKGMPTHKTTLV